MINNRIFGSSIRQEVQDKLNERQISVEDVDFGETIKIPKHTELSSRTPFVRMWTSCKIIEPGVLAEDLETIEADVYFEGGGATKGEFLVADGGKSHANWKAKAFLNSVKIAYPNAQIVPIYDTDKTLIKYVVKPGGDRDQTDFARKIYEIGNHTYQKNYGSVLENDITNIQGSDTSAEMANQNLPQELKDNPLNKPQSGITSISSETDGALGVVKKTTVNFVVNNFYDYDRIFNRYFLRPGAQIFVDFGWSSIKNLYRPQDLIDKKGHASVQDFLYSTNPDNMGEVTKYQGDLEVIQGIVTDYTSKVLPNGTVECGVTLTSTNSALLSFNTDDNIVSRVKQMLTRGILFLGINAIVENTNRVVEDTEYNDRFNDLQELSSTPNIKKWSATDQEQYEENLKLLASKELSGVTSPSGNAIRTGVFIDSFDADDIYIAWGLFEDLIINSQFGFGKSEEDILDGKDLEVRLNSSNSFTKWNKFKEEEQYIMFRVPEDPPAFLFPEWWGFADTDKDKEYLKGGGSYSYQAKRFPLADYIEKYGAESDDEKSKYSKLSYEQDSRWVNWDSSPLSAKSSDYIMKEDKNNYERIPIREVFVNTEIIIKAFEQNDSVHKALDQIIEDINDNSDGLFDWVIITGETDSELLVVDKNYTNVEMFKSVEEEFDNLFTFNIMTPKSIVKDYSLEFKLPSGNVGNMYAIQGMSHGNTLFSLSSDVDSAVATIATDPDSLSVVYEPDNGSYRLEQLLDKKNDTEMYDVYQDTKRIFNTNLYTPTTTVQGELLNAPLSASNAIDKENFPKDYKEHKEDVEKKDKVAAEDLVNRNDEIYQARGFKVANNFKEYYEMKIVKEGMHKSKANLLPYSLTLTTYGISSILPGDIFRVDYLPKKYEENTFLQTVKVSHNVGPGGWYTTLDTVFRLKPEKKQEYYDVQDRNKVVLSAKALQTLNLDSEIQINNSTFKSLGYADDAFPFEELMGYMVDLKIDYQPDSKIDLMFNFKTSPKISEFISGGDGLIQNWEGYFGAFFQGTNNSDPCIENFNLKAIDNNLYYYVGNQNQTGNDLVTYIDYKWKFGAVMGEVFVAPPSCQLLPDKEYSLWVHGNSWCILERDGGRGKQDYEGIKKFFMKYTGFNIPFVNPWFD